MTEFNDETILDALRSVADELIDIEFARSEKRRSRDALIVRAREARVPFRAIADACLVSHQTIANIVERESAHERENGAAGAGATTTPQHGRSE